MPPPKLWSLVLKDQGDVYLKYDSELRSEYGYVEDIRARTAEQNTVKVKKVSFLSTHHDIAYTLMLS